MERKKYKCKEKILDTFAGIVYDNTGDKCE